MSDAKTERLINLTLALLAAKRYLTKSEIYASVAGYEGSPETKERMFERDKDDLRSLGIDIEVGDLDPFFQDEPGYRIRPDNYALDLGDLAPAEVAILSVAADVWRESSLSESTHSALRKLRALGVPADFSGITTIDFASTSSNTYFEKIINAIEERRTLTFKYQGLKQSQSEIRRVNPYVLNLWRGFWYLIGWDLDKNDSRVFKLARIDGDLEVGSKKKSFEIPADFSSSELFSDENSQEVESATIFIEAHRALELRNKGELLKKGDGWDEYQFALSDQRQLLQLLLPYAENVIVKAPDSLVQATQSALAKLVKNG